MEPKNYHLIKKKQMTSNGDIALTALYAVINMLISIIVGIILSLMGVLTPKTRQVVSAVNYNVLVPVYGWIYIFQAVNQNRLTEFGVIVVTVICSYAAGFILVLTFVFLLNSNVRGRFAYTFVIVYTNAIVMPQMLTQSTCDPGGKYSSWPACKQALVKPYSSIPSIVLNLAYWVTVLPTLQYEKQLAQNSKKAFAVILNFYDSLDRFLVDENFENRVVPKFDEEVMKINAEKGNPGDVRTVTPKPAETMKGEMELRETNAAMTSTPIEFTNPRFIKEYFAVMNKSRYQLLMERYDLFEKTKLIKEENPEKEAELVKGDQKRVDSQVAYCLIKRYVLEPEGLLIPGEKDDLCSIEFYYRRIVKSPPAIWSIIGLICGFIFPFNNWFFDPTNNPLPTFISSVQTIGGMMSPISMFLLGTYLAQASYVTPDLLIQWKHVIISNVVRNICLPLVGYFWIFVVLNSMSYNIFQNNPPLTLMLYTYWMVPNGIVLIGVYVVADYYAKEFAVLSVYLNIIAIPMMTVFLIIYFILYGNYTGN